MHPLKKQALSSAKSKTETALRAYPKGHDIQETYKVETHPSTDRLREAQSKAPRHDDKMPKAAVTSKYGKV